MVRVKIERKKFLWSTVVEEVVEVMGQGHFPSTIMVKQKNGHTFECDDDTLHKLEKKE